MQITDVRVKILPRGNQKAIASITFDDEFTVREIRIIETVKDGEKKLFAAMPSKKTPRGEHRDQAHPINQEARDKIQNAILKEYEIQLKNADTQEN